METINNLNKSEPNIQVIEGVSRVGMPTCSIEKTEGVRRYYTNFPALNKENAPQPCYLPPPPPAWCRKSAPDAKIDVKTELTVSNYSNSKNKKLISWKERHNSYHPQKNNNKKRCCGCNIYNKSFDSKEILPEWVTYEGVWDIETQDPVKEFITAIALDEGYGTCEKTVTDEIKEITEGKIGMIENVAPDWDDRLDLDGEWVITEDLNPRVRTPTNEELFAKFEAKFDSSIKALWSKDLNTPNDEYQDPPIDFQDLLSPPSFSLFANPTAEKCSPISLTESIWSTEAAEFPPPLDRGDSSSCIADALHDRFRKLNLANVVEPEPREPKLYTLFGGDEISVANTMRSFTAINHSRDSSSFVEVPPRRSRSRTRTPRPSRAPRHAPARVPLVRLL